MWERYPRAWSSISALSRTNTVYPAHSDYRHNDFLAITIEISAPVVFWCGITITWVLE